MDMLEKKSVIIIINYDAKLGKRIKSGAMSLHLSPTIFTSLKNSNLLFP